MDRLSSRRCCSIFPWSVRWTMGHVFTSMCAVLLIMTRSSLQVEYSFTSQPDPYYYIVEGDAGLIPCAAEITWDDGTTQPISTTLTLNSEPFDIYDIGPDTRIFAHVTNLVVVGMLVLRAEPGDSGTVLGCSVVEGNLTTSTTIYVDNGRPLVPSSNPIQTDDTIHSITVDWGESLTPSQAPLTHYNIHLVELLETEREMTIKSQSNETNDIVTGLQPGTMYRITVAGVNMFGEGQRSSYVVGMTSRPLVPPPPSGVSVEVRESGNTVDVIVSWTPTPIDPDMMTPITHHVVYYGRDQDNLMNYTTLSAEVTQYSLNRSSQEGEWLVGVASVNSAGASQAEFREITVTLPTESTGSYSSSTGGGAGDNTDTSTTSHSQSTTLAPPVSIDLGSPTVAGISSNLTLIIAVAGGCVIFLIVIAIIIIIICVVRYRVKKLRTQEESYNLDRPTTDTPIDELDGSPSVKTKSTHSPKQNGKDLNDREMHFQYHNEPRRAGSRSPPPENDYTTHNV